MRFPFPRRTGRHADRRIDTERILAQYVLNMSITCLGCEDDDDVTPLYEEYIKDARLGASEKADLTEIYHSLFPGASSSISRQTRTLQKTRASG